MVKRSSPETLPEEGPRKRVHLSSEATIATLVAGITRWSSSDISTNDLPPLPPVTPELELQAFTHPGIGGPNYEKLEWYGDAALEMISTELVMETFDHLPVGRCSQIREQLVRNITLSEYYRQYGMAKRTRLPKDMGTMEDLIRTKPRDRDVIKIQGDIFEAYVGAVIKSDSQNGRANAVSWLKALWGRTINDQIKQAEERHEASAKAQEARPTQQGGSETTSKGEQTPKDRLSHKIVVRGIKIRYEDMPCKKKDKNLNLPLYAIGAYLDGWGETNKLLGIGTALRKKEAGDKAAMVALENRKLLKVYEDKKKAYLDEAKASKAA
ncbi:hypothetical protein F66182_8642 [Fusarium sp. NRRL 66182]|nr:hypothetical protein F66182_8642 [Fusarium sp. NRRL 66182]